MAWSSVDAPLGASVPGAVDTTAAMPLGTVARFRDPTLGEGTFIYLPGVASTAHGNWVTYQVTYGATGPTAATVRWTGTVQTGMPLAIATAATVASTFGWYQVVGAAVASVSGTIAAGDDLFWQANGVVHATQTNGKMVLNAVATSAHGVPAANQAIVQIAWPCVQGQLV